MYVYFECNVGTFRQCNVKDIGIVFYRNFRLQMIDDLSTTQLIVDVVIALYKLHDIHFKLNFKIGTNRSLVDRALLRKIFKLKQMKLYFNVLFECFYLNLLFIKSMIYTYRFSFTYISSYLNIHVL